MSVGSHSQSLDHSAIYYGSVRHRRMDKIHRAFTYKVFMVYLDLDELDATFSRTKLWSHKGFSLAWLRTKDYGNNTKEHSLKEQIVQRVESEIGKRPLGPIKMLTNLRYFGFLINPITCYYCFDEKGESIEYIVAEVTNTPWRERIHYVLDVSACKDNKQHAVFDKHMHVSPFQSMDSVYHWYSKTPSSKLLVHLDVKQLDQNQQPQSTFDASLNLNHYPMNAKTMNYFIVRYPWMTVKVFGAIYWQAIKLWLKKAPFYSNPGSGKRA